MEKIRISFIVLILLGLYGPELGESANILGIFPYAGPSQYITAQLYFKTLAARGHDVTVISQFPQKEKLKNFRDITIHTEGYEELMSSVVNGTMPPDFFDIFVGGTTLLVLDNPEVQDLLHSGKYHFDLVITETLFTEALYAIGPHFKAHLIGISTLGTEPNMDSYVGNPSPLSYIPLPSSGLPTRMNFWERLQNIGAAIMDWQLIYSCRKAQVEIYKKYFPHLPYELNEITKNFSLILLNQHFSLSFPRPYVPNMIEVGGWFIKENPSPLPKDIEDFINGAEHGVIYFSLGSNLKGKFLSQQKRDALLNVFKSLKQRILWKFEDPKLPGKPENVLISKWFPQPDILAHPKVKLFITHGGLLSTIETIHHAKPILGIPVAFDQFQNIEASKKLGIGLSVSFAELNEKDLREAVNELLKNKTYEEAVKRISKRYHDQPMKPLERAIYWTEYILRHDGAEFMRVAGRDLNFFQYHSLDTFGFILICLLTVGFIAILILKSILRFALSFKNRGRDSKRKRA